MVGVDSAGLDPLKEDAEASIEPSVKIVARLVGRELRATGAAPAERGRTVGARNNEPD